MYEEEDRKAKLHKDYENYFGVMCGYDKIYYNGWWIPESWI